MSEWRNAAGNRRGANMLSEEARSRQAARMRELHKTHPNVKGGDRRRQATASQDTAVRELRKIAADPKATARDKISAVNALIKLGAMAPADAEAELRAEAAAILGGPTWQSETVDYLFGLGREQDAIRLMAAVIGDAIRDPKFRREIKRRTEAIVEGYLDGEHDDEEAVAASAILDRCLALVPTT